jgi:hypothetical protein
LGGDFHRRPQIERADDGWPETELNFKFRRQATNKIDGLSAETAGFLRGFFDWPTARMSAVVGELRSAIQGSVTVSKADYRNSGSFGHCVALL